MKKPDLVSAIINLRTEVHTTNRIDGASVAVIVLIIQTFFTDAPCKFIPLATCIARQSVWRIPVRVPPIFRDNSASRTGNCE